MSPSGRKRRGRLDALQRYEREKRRNPLAEPGPFPFVMVLDHLKAGFNVPKIFRSAQAFGARAVHLIGVGPFDPAPAKGAFRAVPARFHDTFATCHGALDADGYCCFTLEPGGGECLFDAELPLKSAFIFGHEEGGLSFDPNAHAGMGRLTIPHFGPVQSLNVSVAASVVMYEYVRRYWAGVDMLPLA